MSTKPKYVYTINERGVVFRGEKGSDKPEAIAGVKDGKLRFAHPDFGRYHLPVRKFLEQPAIAAKLGPVEVIMPDPDRKPRVRDAVEVHPGTNIPAHEGPIHLSAEERRISETSAGGEGEGVSIPSTSDEEAKMDTAQADGPDGMRSLTVEQRKAVNLLRSKEGFPLGELERPALPPPNKTSGAGDKTPAYVAWMLRYHPAEFVRVYGVDRVGAIEVTVPGKVDLQTGVKKPATRHWEDGHVLARRATIFTKVAHNRREEEKEESVSA